MLGLQLHQKVQMSPLRIVMSPNSKRGFKIGGATGNLIISDSSFNRNRGIGGSFFLFPESILTILSSHFDQNEVSAEGLFGRGLPYGGMGNSGTTTIISSTANGNSETGLAVFTNDEVYIWDSEFSNNGRNGLSSQGSTFNVIKSVICSNNNVDVFQSFIAQAVTCDTSDPPQIGENRVCQCPCPRTYSGGTSAGGNQVSTQKLLSNFTHTPPIQPYPLL